MGTRDKLILGTVQLGLDYGISNKQGKPSTDKAFEILDMAFDSGIRTLDTANAYGDALDIISRYHHETNKKFRVVNKFHLHNLGTLHATIKEQLASLGIPQYQSLLFHSFHDFDIAGNAVKKQLWRLKEEGLIKELGVSVYTREQLKNAINTERIDAVQLPFNVLDNAFQRIDLLKEAKDKGKIIQARSVFLQGLFFKELNSFPEYLDPLKKYIHRLSQISEASGRSVEEICLSYALSQPEIDFVLIGVDSTSQLQRNLSFVDCPLDRDILEAINSIQVKETELLYPYNWK